MRVFSILRIGQGVSLGKGNFSELIISIVEMFTGLHILVVGERTITDSILLERVSIILPTWSLGILWLFSGVLTFIGMCLYYLEYRTPIERMFRVVGSFMSIYVWLSAALILFPSPFLYIYCAATIASMRVTRLVWRD